MKTPTTKRMEPPEVYVLPTDKGHGLVSFALREGELDSLEAWLKDHTVTSVTIEATPNKA